MLNFSLGAARISAAESEKFAGIHDVPASLFSCLVRCGVRRRCAAMFIKGSSALCLIKMFSFCSIRSVRAEEGKEKGKRREGRKEEEE